MPSLVVYRTSLSLQPTAAVIVRVLAGLTPAAFALFLFAGGGEPPPGLPLPQWLNLTAFFGAVTVVGMVLSVMVYGIRLPRWGWWLVGLYVFLGILMLVSLWYTPAIGYGSSKVLRFLTIGSLAAIGPLLLFRRERDIYLFLATVVAIALVMALAVLFGAETYQRSVFGANHIVVGRMIGTGLVILTFLIAHPRGSLRLVGMMLVPFLLFLAALLATDARGPFLAVLVALPAVAALHLLRIIPRPSGKSAAIALLACGIVVVFTVWSPLRLASGLQTRVGELAQDLEDVGEVVQAPDFGGRWPRFVRAVEVFSEHPFVGVGIGGYGVLFTGEDQREYPHNILLELAAELGLAGLVVFLALLGIGALGLLRAQKHDPPLSTTTLNLLLALLFFWLFASMVSGDVNDNRVLFAVIGLLYAGAGMRPVAEPLSHPITPLPG